jgi:nucleotide-binding universal stress UspA family protein
MDASLRVLPGGDPSPPPSLLVASTGGPIDKRVLDEAVSLARTMNPHPVMHVLSIAQVFGTSLGLQHPGLYPTKREWKAQADIVAEAVKALERRGFVAKGRVLGSRHAGKAIANVAAAEGCAAIVIGAVPMSRWRQLLLQDEIPKLVRRATVPVRVVDM